MPRHHLLRRHAAPAPETTDNDSPQPRTSGSRLGHGAAQPQFQTPPARGIPQLYPSSGPIEAAQPTTAHPGSAAQAALFSLFGRGVSGRQRAPMMDEDDEDEPEELEEEEEADQTFDMDNQRLELDPEEEEEEEERDFSEEEMEGMVGEELEGEEDEDELMHDRDRSPSPLPSNLREISSLASWTVSTHKPGCGVAALRHPSPTQYWQSDGPQPHTLSLHFFKLVAVVKIRVYLDFEMDESYTPTKMTFHAGMGGNDLVEFATWEGEGPCGWVEIPLEGVGGRDGGWVRRRRRKHTRARTQDDKGKRRSKGARVAWPDAMFSDAENPVEYDEAAYDYDDGESADEDDDDPYAGNVLKAMVLQMRVTENHQNGKDTHVRGFQVFARDDDRRRMGNAPSASADGRTRRHSVRRSLRGSVNDDGTERRNINGETDGAKVGGLEEPDWMGEPVIR
ncbi:anaphase promoting complex subunit DOC1 [Aspergillus clavatus NRRL 1]|uniref:Anaphase promoting complex subunit 10 (APC10), putative n=1 Tax=Aspergillus clavatus (strain ATCC 1007 / CBS 513.65 / DSM 816 / NCTC 3887 / NRRL 1 / QM 1276 / 107) TaxID=344612 RepID=A1CNN4_ASPCL|nr:anaphase promoting complex subunit 10 (APC10), putative [Aspergillus clavatus NRRL 1]EAW07255.1 anaphase promoting complex subunit 10 (APC10), putative [Aspergillus clavatus NRRL 1]